MFCLIAIMLLTVFTELSFPAGWGASRRDLAIRNYTLNWNRAESPAYPSPTHRVGATLFIIN